MGSTGATLVQTGPQYDNGWRALRDQLKTFLRVLELNPDRRLPSFIPYHHQPATIYLNQYTSARKNNNVILIQQSAHLKGLFPSLLQPKGIPSLSTRSRDTKTFSLLSMAIIGEKSQIYLLGKARRSMA